MICSGEVESFGFLSSLTFKNLGNLILSPLFSAICDHAPVCFGDIEISAH